MPHVSDHEYFEDQSEYNIPTELDIKTKTKIVRILLGKRIPTFKRV